MLLLIVINLFFPILLFDFPENIVKPLVFWCFQEAFNFVKNWVKVIGGECQKSFPSEKKDLFVDFKPNSLTLYSSSRKNKPHC